MKIWFALSILAPAGLALAQPSNKPAPPPPLCAPSYANTIRVVANGADVITCWTEEGKPESCIAVASTGVPRKVPTPAVPLPVPVAEVRDQGGKLSACAGATCVKLGKKLTAAIAAAKAKQAKEGADYYGDSIPHPTANLEAVVIDRTAWNVRGDKLLKPKPPREYAKNKREKPGNSGVEVAGNLLIANWSDCAGPCTMAVVIDGSGKTKGDWFPAGKAIALDDKRVAILPDESDAVVTVLEPATAKQLGKLRLAEGVLEGLQATKVDAQTIAAVWHEDAWKVVWISFPPTGSPSLATTKEIATCP